MNEIEYWEKSTSVAKTIVKLFRGITVSPAERLKACFDMIQLSHYDNLSKNTEKTKVL